MSSFGEGPLNSCSTFLLRKRIRFFVKLLLFISLLGLSGKRGIRLCSRAPFSLHKESDLAESTLCSIVLVAPKPRTDLLLERCCLVPMATPKVFAFLLGLGFFVGVCCLFGGFWPLCLLSVYFFVNEMLCPLLIKKKKKKKSQIKDSYYLDN